MDTINDIITFLLVLIPIGAGGRVIYCLMAMSADTDEEKSYKIRIRNVLIFTAFAECVTGLVKGALPYYFG